MATFFESGTWVWIPDEDEVVLPAKAKTAFRLGEKATVVMENGSVRYTCFFLSFSLSFFCLLVVLFPSPVYKSHAKSRPAAAGNVVRCPPAFA